MFTLNSDIQAIISEYLRLTGPIIMQRLELLPPSQITSQSEYK